MSQLKDPSGTIVHEIRWRDALPWWILFRAAGAAFSPTVILLAAAGCLATWAGWSLADRLGLAVSDPTADLIAAAKSADVLVLPGPAGGLPGPAATLTPSREVLPWLSAAGDRLPAAVGEFLGLLGVPFRPGATVGQLAGAVVRLAWFVLVWSIFGTAITRHVALKLVDEEVPGLVGATLFGSRKWLSSFNSVAFVLLGILALSVPGGLLGLLMRTDWGLAVAGVVWPLVLLGAVVLAILAVGLVAGWPLMVAAVGVERGDSFQAISTAFSYVYQRPLHFLFYAALALLVAIPALAAAGLLADASITFAFWASSLGMGHERTTALLEGLRGSGPLGEAWGARAIAFWTRGAGTLLGSFGWGYFWAIATAAYLLLRHDVDGTELDEVVIDEPPGNA